jgi:gliding motility-associated-like protein
MRKPIYIICKDYGKGIRILLILTSIVVGINFKGFTQNKTVKEVEISFCESNIIAIDLNKAIGLSFPDGTGYWYNESNERVSNIFIPKAPVQEVYSFYFQVENAVVNCNLNLNDRYTINIRRNDIAPPLGDEQQNFCSQPGEEPTLADLHVEGESILWYSQAQGGEKLTSAELLENGKTYYAAERLAGCGESIDRLAVTALVDVVPKLQVNDPGSQQPGFDIANLTVEDQHEAVGEITWHTQRPESAEDMSCLMKETKIFETQTICVMKVTPNGCYDIAEVNITIDACDIKVLAEVNHVRCFGEENGSIELKVTSSADVNFEYLWSNGDDGFLVENLTAGDYTVTVKPDNSCEDIVKEFTITQPEELQLTVEAKNETGVGRKDGQAKALVQGGTPAYKYLWDDIGSQTSATAIQLGKGEYKVVVTDENGCEVSGIALIEEDLLFPDGFSPNGDGINEKFKIAGLEKYPDAYLEVVNRWGQVVYKKKSYGNESRWGTEDAWWDGRSASKLKVGNGLLPAGTYIYFLKLGGDSSKVIKGTIFINR